jgi:DNA polymerase bacteriophage-type
MPAFIDFETRSTVDLKKAGIDAYAEHPTTGVWCLCWQIDDGPVREWTGFNPYDHDDDPGELLSHIQDGKPVVAHNAGFELGIWKAFLGPGTWWGWPELKPEQVICTMARACALALPAGLDELSRVMKLPHEKDDAGHRLMLRMSKPRRIEPDGKIVWWDDAERINRLVAYCKQDVRAEADAFHRLYPLSPSERELWNLDYQINSRGVQLDIPTIKRADAVTKLAVKAANDELKALTGGTVSAVTQAAKLGEWLRGKGVVLDNLQAETVETALAGSVDDPHARRALELRKAAGGSSTKKLAAMLAAVCHDGRARGLLKFHSASTGRWGGARVQPQNLPRPELPQSWIEAVLAAVRDEPDPSVALSLVELLAGSPLEALASCLRALIVAAPGHELIGGDYANIEGRMAAWLTGETWKLKAFREYDAGTGPDLYKLAYARSFGLDVVDVDKSMRQIGKVMELALQYQGAVGAFASMAANYGIRVIDDAALSAAFSDPQLDRMADAGLEIGDDTPPQTNPSGKAELRKTDVLRIVNRWRRAHPLFVAAWKDLEKAAITAVIRNGERVEALGGRVAYFKRGAFLQCELPSGRLLSYAKPRIVERDRGKGVQLEFEGVDSKTHQWVKQRAYGGMHFNNIVQGASRDVLVDGIRALERASYPVVLHVHDEDVAEVPEGWGDLREFEQLMCASTSTWAKGLPLAVEAWRGKRYQK